MGKDYIPICTEWRDMVEELSDEEVGKVFMAAFEYNASKTVTEFHGLAAKLFEAMKDAIDMDEQGLIFPEEKQ